jgi:surface antigen
LVFVAESICEVGVLNRKCVIAVVVTAALAAGCAGGGPNETVGTIGGAVAGGVLGSAIGAGTGNVAATVAGAAIGGFLGNQIGRSLDLTSQQRATSAQYQALEYGTAGAPVAWRDEAFYGTVIPGPFYSTAGYQRCREYTHTVYVNGQPQTARGIACRQTDGSWIAIN